MEQSGKIVELLDNGTAKVLMRKHTDCGKCGACEMGRGMDMFTVARNPIDAKVGDTVEITMETKNVLSAAFIMYVIPLIALLAGILLGNKISGGESEGMSLLLGFVFLALTYFVIKLNEKKYIKKYTAVIKRKVEI